MKKVLFVETSPSGLVGGSFLSLLELNRALDKERFQALVLFRHDHYLVEDFRRAGAEVLIYDGQASSKSSTAATRKRREMKTYLGRILDSIKQRRNIEVILTLRRERPFAARAMEIIQECKVDLLHLNDGLTPALPFIAAMPAAFPVVVHERKIRNYAPVERQFIKKVNRMICITRAVADNVQMHFPNFSRSVTIPNPLSTRLNTSPDTRKKLIKQWGLPDDAFLLIQISNIISWKGQDAAVEAMRIVSRANPRAVLLLAGGTPPGEEAYEARLRKMVRTFELGDRVVFCGFQEKIGAYYHAADVVVHVPSGPEPFGRVVLEAMQLGKPVITSRIGGTAELVQHGVTGLLVPPREPAVLASAILTLVGDESLRQRLGKEAARVAQEEYSPQSITRRVEAIYEELME